jgi:NhaP-type Na+/H+ or K+/H+ antiporter
MVMLGTVTRMPLSSAIIYLGVGYALGPSVLGVLSPDPLRYAPLLRPVAEVAVLISLFTVGLKMGVPLSDRRWFLPLRLASLSMAITVGLIAAAGVWGLSMSVGAAVLLGAILAPTDPVLASGVQMQTGPEPDRVRFSLAGEGGLNDGTAFPFVMLGLGLLGLHDLGRDGWRWWSLDLLWGTLGGLSIGAALGASIGWLVVRLRTRRGGAAGWDEFLSLGLVACAYGAAQLSMASGFLGVFAAGLALQRVKEQPRAGTAALDATSSSLGAHTDRATHSHHASLAMSQAVQGFNEQLEKVAELGIVVIVGAMLPYITPSFALCWFIPLLLAVVRPLAVAAAASGERLAADQRFMVGWFGIRGIGSVFYLLFAIESGINGALADELVTLTLATVAASILVHGLSAQPLMRWYGAGKSRLRAREQVRSNS